MICETTTTSTSATQALGARLAPLLKGGEVIELASDLGGGKTTFVQGLMRGLGYKEEVTSPTFTLAHAYHVSPKLEVHHYDLYRLGDAGIMSEELAEDLQDNHIITVIEWAGIVSSELPADRLTVTFEQTGEATRHIIMTGGGSVSDKLVKGVKR